MYAALLYEQEEGSEGVPGCAGDYARKVVWALFERGGDCEVEVLVDS